MKIATIIYTLLIVGIAILPSCKFDGNPTENNDAPIYLDSLMPSPAPPEFEKNIGDRIAIIEENGKFDAYCQILDKADTVYLIASSVGRSNLQEWVKADEYRSYYKNAQNSSVAAIKTDAYEIRIGNGRLSKIIWIEGSSIFPAPWIELKSLKKNDSVLIRRFGDFEPHHAIILEDVKANNNWALVRYKGYNSSEVAEYDYIFNSIDAAIYDSIVPGNILYYDKMNWVMMIAPKDSLHAIVRTSNFPPIDMVVPLKKLQVLK